MIFRLSFPTCALALLCACGGGGSSAPSTSGPAPTATATATASATASASAAPTSVPAGLAAANVPIGSGYSDVSPHQLVRSSADRLYVATPTCASLPACGSNALVMYAGDGAGTPSGFAALDAADEPQAQGSSDSIGTSSIAIDANDLIWVAWIERANGGTVHVSTFDTTTGTWSTTPSFVQTTGNTGFVPGKEGVVIALDANGAPHVAYVASGSNAQMHVMYANRVAGTWSTPAQIDDEAIPSGQSAMHPTIAFAPDGSLLFAWLDGPGAEYTTGTIHTRVRSASGTLSPSTLIAGSALAAVDQGPSLLITADGTRHLTFVDPNVYAKYWYSADGKTWNGDRQPPSQQTHDPSLGPDGASGVYIYGHGTPQGAIDGVGQNLYRFHLASGSTAWSSFALWVTGSYDCSISTRWSQYFMRFPAELDSLYWNPNVAPFALLLGEG